MGAALGLTYGEAGETPALSELTVPSSKKKA